MTKKRNPQYVDSSLFVHGITLTFSMKSAKINPYIIMKNAVLCTDRGKQSKRVVLFLERAGFMETMKNIPKVSVINFVTEEQKEVKSSARTNRTHAVPAQAVQPPDKKAVRQL